MVTHQLEIIKSTIKEAEAEIEINGITFYQPEWSI